VYEDDFEMAGEDRQKELEQMIKQVEEEEEDIDDEGYDDDDEPYEDQDQNEKRYRMQIEELKESLRNKGYKK